MGPGKKYDEGKLRWDLLPLEPIEDIVRILTMGTSKYGDDNWQRLENGVERYYAAMMRHITAWRKGEELDKESGLPHLHHAMCNLMFINWIKHQNENEIN